MTELLTQNYGPILNGNGILDCSVREYSNIFTHPLENGVKISDYKVIMPTDITLRIAVKGSEYNSIYYTLDGIFKNSTLVSIQTSARIYKNMVLSELPYKESAQHFDTMIMDVKFKKAILVKASAFKVKKGKFSKAKHKVVAHATKVPTSDTSSIAYKLLNKFKGYL